MATRLTTRGGGRHWRRGWAAAVLLALGGLAALSATGVRAAGFVADLSDHLVAITTGFTGSQILLFGALEEPGGEVVVVVRGPAGDAGVRRKRRVGPVWIHTHEERFREVPSYYAVAASGPIEELAEPGELARHQIGVENLRLDPVEPGGLGPGELAAFRAALVRGKQQAGLYPMGVGTVSFPGATLFRTRVAFPANVTPGTYDVQVFQLEGGRVTQAQASELDISKVGLEAGLYDFAHRLPALYALATIALAGLAGWGASVLFRRA